MTPVIVCYSVLIMFGYYLAGDASAAQKVKVKRSWLSVFFFLVKQYG